MKYKKLLALLSVLFLYSCTSVTMQPSSGYKIANEPNYQESKHYFFWGLVGEKNINVNEICSNSSMAQMQSQVTFVDGLLTAITLGIYAPVSSKVWCK